jgi:hypothetical protein
MGEKCCRRKAAHAAQGSTLRRAFQAGLEALRLESGLSRTGIRRAARHSAIKLLPLMTSAANPSLELHRAHR